MKASKSLIQVPRVHRHYGKVKNLTGVSPVADTQATKLQKLIAHEELKLEKIQNQGKRGAYVPKNKQIIDMPMAIRKNQQKTIHYGDPRYTSDTSSIQYQPRAPYVQQGIAVNPVLNVEAVTGISAAFMARALAKGAYSDENPNDIINAANFIQSVLFSAAAGGAPLTTKIPSYLGVIYHSLTPKDIVFKKQLFNYAFQGVPTQTAFATQQVYGAPSAGGKINFGIISDQQGYSGLNIISPGTIDTDTNVQAQAFNRVAQFLARNDAAKRKKAHLPLTIQDIKYLNTTSAAYSCPTITYGNAFGGSGGDVVRLGNETPVTPDVLGVFAVAPTSFASANRAPNCNSSRGGGCMEAALLTSSHAPYDLAKITRPVFKYINVNNLFYVFCKSLSKAIQLYINQPNSLIVSELTPNGSQALLDTILPKCTLQDAFFAFRNALMLAFSRSQWAVQSMTPTNSTAETFIGLACGVGTHPVFIDTSLQMSAYLQENIRSLLARSTKDEDNMFRWFIPVLGVATDDEFDGHEFDIILNGVNNVHVNVPLFTQFTETAPKDKVFPPFPPKNTVPSSPNAFNNKVHKPLPTAPGAAIQFTINQWDGSSQSGYLQINQEEYLIKTVNALNKSTIAVSKFLQARANFATAPSANALCQLGTNYYLTPIPEEVSGNKYGSKMSVLQISYGYDPDQDIVEGFPMVPPTRIVTELTSVDLHPEITVVSSTNLESYATKTKHKYKGMVWSDYLDGVADMCVGDGTTLNSVKRIQQLSAQGKGGIASDLLSVFGPAIGAVAPVLAKGVDTLLPF